MTKLTPKKFYFIRHGLTDWNDQQLCQGQLDIELNEAGRQEARALGEFIKNFPFSRICASPLKRAVETAEILQGMLPDCQLHLIDEFKERCWGKLEGISSAQMYHIEKTEEENLPLLKEKGVEDREAFKSRILCGLNRALAHDDAPLIVSHGRVFLLICELLNTPPIRQIPNTTLIECSPSEEGWQLNLIRDSATST